MKKVDAIIRPDRLEAVKDALALLGLGGITVVDARGHGCQGGVSQQWRGEAYVVDLLPKTIVTVVVQDHELRDCLDVIAKAAWTGRLGDGKVFVTAVEDAVRIRTGESGAQAL